MIVEKRTKGPLHINRAISVLLGSAILKDTFFVFSSKVGATILGFIGSIIIVREMGPLNFGLYATAMAFIPLISGLFDFGLSTAAIKFGALYLREDNKKADILFKIIGKQKAIISLFVCVIGILTAKIIAINLYNKPELVYPLRISMLCIVVNILSTYVHTIMQTRQLFLRSSVISFVVSVIRLGSILILFLAFRAVTIKNMLLLQLGLGFFSVFFSFSFLDRKFLFTKYDRDERSIIVRDLFNFSKWVMISSFCWPFLHRLDIVMLNYYVDASLVGIYACAFQLVTPLMLLKGSFHNVLLPKISKISSYRGYMNYGKKFTLLSIGLCIGFIPIILFSRPMIEFVFGAKYSQSSYIFQILMVKMMFVLVFNPLHLIAYSAGHPWIISVKDIFALFLNIGLNIILIPMLGISGAAYGTLLTTVIGGAVPLIYIYFKILLPLEKSGKFAPKTI